MELFTMHWRTEYLEAEGWMERVAWRHPYLWLAVTWGLLGLVAWFVP